MKTTIQKIAIRHNALLIPNDWVQADASKTLNSTTTMLVANCNKLGFGFSEELLVKINAINPTQKLEQLEMLKEITGVNKNWTPLVKQWNIPTGESVKDHFITLFANMFRSRKGTQMPCGHLIPFNTFPIERYNGCPFCGTPFEFEKLEYEASPSKLKVLELWSEEDLKRVLLQMLKSPVPLDATQADSLKALIAEYGVPKDAEITMKETIMLVVDALVAAGHAERAGSYFDTPNDVLRYLWYKHTGYLQLIEPRTIIKRMKLNAKYRGHLAEQSAVEIKSIEDLKLKFSRPEARRYAQWLNGLTMPITQQCEIMHPKRGMWVRVIRALRLSEYSKKKGFAQLAELLDSFHNERYEVWQGKLNDLKLKADAEGGLGLLQTRPGLFARSLFSSMLWFGPDITIAKFKEVLHLVPARLILTLNMVADNYFESGASRTVRPLGGVSKRVPNNRLLQLYSSKELERMRTMVKDLSLDVIKRKFEQEENQNTSIYIESGLDNIPIAIGDRSDQIQDLPSALMGTRFKVEGDTVRLFMQWGNGLKAQHLDMDLSCRVVYDSQTEFCSYQQLVIPGCKHSGDIQRIPDLVGTAEYIDLDLSVLRKSKARYVSFTCNAYSSGSISPNLVVGWMNSRSPMNITSSGVAYEPSAVQHQVRITQGMAKGLVFGVLDVQASEIIWIEMPFGGQLVQNMSIKTLETFIKKLDAKIKIGELLRLKAQVQGLQILDQKDLADEVYDVKWAANTAEVSALFL